MSITKFCSKCNWALGILLAFVLIFPSLGETQDATSESLQELDSGATRRLPSGRTRQLLETPGEQEDSLSTLPAQEPSLPEEQAPITNVPVESLSTPDSSIPETSSESPAPENQPIPEQPVSDGQGGGSVPGMVDQPSQGVDEKPAGVEKTVTQEEGLPQPSGGNSGTSDSPKESGAPDISQPSNTIGDSNSGRRLPSGRSRPTIVGPADGPTEAEMAEFERSNFIPIRDRWRIGYTGGLLDPYSQNLLKADYPIIGQDIFFNFVGISDSLFEARKLPTPQGASRERSGTSGKFFGKGRQLFFNQNLVASFEIFKGDTGFRPRDWAIRITPVFNVNYLNVQERGIVNLDVREGTDRTDTQIALQEAFFEKRLFNVSRQFDFVSVRAGIQGFTSDFRGFIFADNEPGIRFFGNFNNNRYQWNVAYFNLLEKDTNSMLNSFQLRHRQVVVANIYMQDFLWKGYTTQLSFHYDRDEAGSQDGHDQKFDTNGFIVRPARLGTLIPHNIQSYYLGWAGEGHINRFNISHAFYQVFGDVGHDPIADRYVSINAQMAALELSYDIDWWRPKISLFYGSGDKNPTDGVARGFDSILDNVNFAGNGFSYFNRQGLPLSQTGVFLVNRFSFLSDLRSSKIQGQAQFVNPGVIVLNAGVDVEATPKLKVLFNFNQLWFASTATLEYVLHQPDIRQSIGQDYSVGFIYRPLLNQNVVLTAGFAYLVPGGGLKDIQGGEDLYSTFLSATLTF